MTEKGPVLLLFAVSHPVYGTARVVSTGPDGATVAAAEVWGVPEEWGRIAGYCDVRKLGPARRPRCRRCGQEFGKNGEAEGLCPFCRQAEALYRRQMGAVRSKDRRAGYRDRA